MNKKLHKFTKLDVAPNPLCESAQSVEEYRLDLSKGWDGVFQYEGLSPNVGYWIVGELLAEPKVGEVVRFYRHNRNGVECKGDFTSSTVTDIKGDLIFTRNSVYRLEEMPSAEELEADYQAQLLEDLNAAQTERFF